MQFVINSKKRSQKALFKERPPRTTDVLQNTRKDRYYHDMFDNILPWKLDLQNLIRLFPLGLNSYLYSEHRHYGGLARRGAYSKFSFFSSQTKYRVLLLTNKYVSTANKIGNVLFLHLYKQKNILFVYFTFLFISNGVFVHSKKSAIKETEFALSFDLISLLIFGCINITLFFMLRIRHWSNYC